MARFVGTSMQKLLTSTLNAIPPKAEDTCFEDTDPPFSPPEPNPEESERDHCVDRIDDELTVVCRDDDDVCYHGSHAIALLSQQIGQRDLLPISRRQAARLRARLQLARDALLPFFADGDQRHVTAGLISAEKFVTWWALSKDQRRVQPSYVSREHRLRVRWLQNALHNLSIIDELDESAGTRRDRLVATIKINSGAGK
ncbi:hypothetical protein [Rhizobium sp. WYJ-E13]|uniref:hypothetical protein n=1 Tax=Rhizobium sp. WYJ-E13 TaxID=2849093 RepID=UPI001C1F0367|nr:hypothetical protein [Rhizobium sp. WYJ-E13]QWW67965.1 hypothetical protein KQ933_20665 [Rhizobium sp. WYJ-E13]